MCTAGIAVSLPAVPQHLSSEYKIHQLHVESSGPLPRALHTMVACGTVDQACDMTLLLSSQISLTLTTSVHNRAQWAWVFNKMPHT